MSFEAKYRGKCDACGDWWSVGEEIRYNDESDLIHVDCQEVIAAERKTETCTECWIIKPCECDS